MKIKDSTSPLISAPSSKENYSSAELKDATTPSAEPLSSSFTREFDALKELIRENRQSKFERLAAHPAVLVILGFLLSGLVGHGLAVYQQDTAAKRSFIDESNKQRVQKIGEVWEQLDLDQHTIDQLLEPDQEITKEFPNPDARAEEIKRIVRGDRAMVSQYRFWLGQRISDRINNYLNANIKYSIRKLAGTSEAELKEDKAARDAAKSDVDQTREDLLQGIPR